MLELEKSTTYTYDAGDGYYIILKIYDTGLTSVYMYHGKVLLPMFIYSQFLTRRTSINSIVADLEKRLVKYKAEYHTYIEISRLHHIKF